MVVPSTVVVAVEAAVVAVAINPQKRIIDVIILFLWNSQKSLGQWLKEQQVPGLFGIDTRALTKKLREHGAMLGRIEFDNISIPFYDPNEHNIVAEVSTKEVVEYGHGKYKVILVDCGVKYNIIRCLLKRDVTCLLYTSPSPRDCS